MLAILERGQKPQSASKSILLPGLGLYPLPALQYALGRRLNRSMTRYIYKAKNGKLLVVLTPSQKAKLIFENNIYELYLTMIFFKLSSTDILKIL